MSVNLVTKIETLKRCHAVMQSLCGWLMGLVFWAVKVLSVFVNRNECHDEFVSYPASAG